MSNRQASSYMIRAYRSSDPEATLCIFHDAVTVTASADYTSEQIAAWGSPESRNLSEWDESLHQRNSYVALVEEQIAGFSDVSEDGYVHMMFVSPKYTRSCVGYQLLRFLENRARSSSAKQLTADVSITARASFEAFGFHTETAQNPVMNGVVMTNFRMVKQLEAHD